MSAVEFLFDFGSPNAYLCHKVLPALEARTGIAFRYEPILLGGVFKLTGNASPAVTLQGIKNKPEYQGLETRRFLARHGITDFRPNPHFPVNTLQLMRGAIVAERMSVARAYIDLIYHHMWEEPKKLDDLELFEQVLRDSELDADALLSGIGEPTVKQALLESTERAVARGVFGSPSFFVGDELFFGKDRLREVEEEALRQRAR